MNPPKPGEENAKVIFDQATQLYIYTGSDSITYEFDTDKKAWFPRITETLLKTHQSIYSVAGVDESIPVENPALKRKLEKQKGVIPPKKPKQEPVKKVTSVFVTGLPLDTTIDEMSDLFKKGGVILLDPLTNEPKIKLYRNEKGEFKGEALVIYLREESVQLACQLLDDTPFRYGVTTNMKVEPAKFRAKEKTEIVDQQEKKLKGKAIQKMKKQLEWFENENVESIKRSKSVVLKHMFTLDELKEQPELLLDIKEDLREECAQFGEVTNVILFDLEPQGVMVVRFKTPESAQACILKMNGRLLDGRRIVAELPKGNENYQRSKTRGLDMDEELKRQEEYGKWLESQGAE